jgi:AraC-like DNA-binding protein
LPPRRSWQCDRGGDAAPARYEFRTVTAGVETLSGHLSMPRHHHAQGYATVVLGGAINEVSFAGRMCAGPGGVLLHGAFDCHLDRASGRGPLQILRLPWRHDALEGQFQVADPDALARLAETDPELAAQRLAQELYPAAAPEQYWADELARALACDAQFLLRDWAEERDLRPDEVSRVFGAEFGVSPKRFRLESRTRLAWRKVRGTTASLTEIALQSGFSDLAHLSRSIHAFTGRAPRSWRGSALASAGPARQVRSSAGRWWRAKLRS